MLTRSGQAGNAYESFRSNICIDFVADDPDFKLPAELFNLVQRFPGVDGTGGVVGGVEQYGPSFEVTAVVNESGSG